MNLEIQSLRRAEAATLRLRGLYESYGYRKYRMGRFEEYSLYAANKSFLLGENVPTFTDLDGRLMALKPDVTLSIAKNTKADKNTCEKVYYLESVYRESKESHTYKEISQMGLECMGGVDDCVIAEVLALALKSLADFETDYVLKISNMDFVVGLMEELPVNADQKDIILGLIRTKNRSGLEKLCADLALPEGDTEKLLKVSGLYGEFGRVLAEAGAIADTPKMKEAVALLSRLYEVLEAMGLGGQLDKVRLDFSMINDIEYYNGIIFQGFLDGLARQVLSGGQYDGMMAKLGKSWSACRRRVSAMMSMHWCFMSRASMWCACARRLKACDVRDCACGWRKRCRRICVTVICTDMMDAFPWKRIGKRPFRRAERRA